MAAACDRGFSTQGAGTLAIQSLIVAWCSTCTKSGQGMPAARACVAHGQLVAEPARGRLAHARHPQVLAEHRGHLDVEIVERDDPVDPLGSGEVRRPFPDVRRPACRA